MSKTYYMHTLNGEPAEFDSGGSIIIFAGRDARLRKDLKQIRREQAVAKKDDVRAGVAGEWTYDYIRVRLPEGE
jgi:hypothetical protein